MIKKIIGWFIVVAFVLSLITAYVIEVREQGWGILLGLVLCFAMIGVFLFGVYLIVTSDE